MNDPQTLPAPERSTALLQSQSNPPHRILVVEDDAIIRQLNTEALTHSGYEVEGAEDGAAAWEALSADSYDLMITDNSMPKVTGVELLKKMRAARMALPVIMATGALPKVEFTRSPWLQPEALLVKPYTVEELLRAVKKVLREAQSTTDNPQPSMQLDMKKNKTSPAGEPASAALPGSAKSPLRILVVDEDSDLCQMYTDALASIGCDVDAAEDGAAGWEALQANKYNLLITENDVPHLSGLELLRKLRAARMALPVVMAAARLPAHELAQNPSLLLAAMLEKPFAVDSLLDTVRNVLRVTDSPPEQMSSEQNRQGQLPAEGLKLC